MDKTQLEGSQSHKAEDQHELRDKMASRMVMGDQGSYYSPDMRIMFLYGEPQSEVVHKYNNKEEPPVSHEPQSGPSSKPK